ncbi:10091_t:CDS:2 [Entrophospora sp. SA101]|nr:2882_t:CDS:2 [Entrophospora candida]CAH1756907.1 5365_t:CDS:2 [Entrophospora sp. SA101]CAJ0637693.1 14776_t:CDS:2 [Entrophospora sp. SA101]CAJ0749110.1 22609_t:CDS:2 [Entrophospora sp. SA101]CAJ0756551.1 21854_t:CDS:2 [Entrophospora sp. SA101]
MANELSSSNLFSLKGKIALVTGGGTGIAAKELNQIGSSSGGKCIPIQADLSSKLACDNLANGIANIEDGKLDILVNNSAVFTHAPLTNILESSWDAVWKVNVVSVFYLTIACLPLLQKASNAPQHPSKVIIIGSMGEGNLESLVAAQKDTALPYNVSKWALNGLSRNLAAYLTPHGVNVNLIAPGLVPTKMTETYHQSSVSRKYRMGNEVDLGAAALYLASDAGSWISGAELRIDGGASLRGKNFDKKLARESTKSKL